MDYFFADYNWIERKIYAYADQLKALDITDIVGISRGGIFPAFLAAQILDIPAIHLLNYDRKSRSVQLQAHKPIGKDAVVLLCEDVPGEGNTMKDCLAFMQSNVTKVFTLSVCYFNGSAMQPDFGHYSDNTFCVLPWERHVFNPGFREIHKKYGYHEKTDSEYFVYGADLDGVFLPDIPESLYQNNLQEALQQRAALTPYEASLFPPNANRDWLIITARPHIGQAQAEQWLKQHGIPFSKLLMRHAGDIDFAPHDDPHMKAEKSAESKAKHIKEHGITHFYESDALQAILIAAKLPMIRVCWWNNALGIRKWITAEPQDAKH